MRDAFACATSTAAVFWLVWLVVQVFPEPTLGGFAAIGGIPLLFGIAAALEQSK